LRLSCHSQSSSGEGNLASKCGQLRATIPRISSSTAPMLSRSKLSSSPWIISSSSGLRGRPCRNSIGVAALFSLHLAIGGAACRPVSTGIGALSPGHHEHRKPITRLPTDASGGRSRVRMSSALLVWQPGQYRATAFRPRRRNGSLETTGESFRHSTARSRARQHRGRCGRGAS
jgi:hypothetical protein